MKVCFVCHLAFAAMVNDAKGHIGGVERQVASMARWFADRGHQVSLVVWGTDNVAPERVGNVRMLYLCREDDGIRGVRFVYPRWYSLLEALREADADLYYHNCAEYVTGQIALWCKTNNRSFIYSIASDPECEKWPHVLTSAREKILFRIGRRLADFRIAQTKTQSDLLRKNTGLTSDALPMPCDALSAEFSRESESTRSGNRVLWIGRIAPVKQLELLLDTAEKCNQIGFDIVGAVDTDIDYGRQILERAASLDNVVLHGRVPFGSVHQFYESADVLCCTSRYEGFPNTFIEAFAAGRPVVSTVDPGGVLESNNIGIHCGSAGDLAPAILSLLSDRSRWSCMSENAIAYFQETHKLEPAMLRFERLFVEVTERRASK